MRAALLVLDREHACLLSHAGDLPSAAVPAGTRPLQAAQALGEREFGVTLGGPAGVMEAAGETICVFVASFPPTSQQRWMPLPRWTADPLLGRAWDAYVTVMLGGWQPPTRRLEVFAFGDSPALAARLAHQVVKGGKRATTCWLEAIEKDGTTIPAAGMVSIVTDGFGYPVCAIETDRVDRVPFRDATQEIAHAEAEGDRTFDYWRQGHLAYFQREAERMGLRFTEDAIVLFEFFHLLKVFGPIRFS